MSPNQSIFLEEYRGNIYIKKINMNHLSPRTQLTFSCNNVVKQPNIPLKSCCVHTVRVLKYVWLIQNILHERNRDFICLNEIFPLSGYTFRKNDDHVLFYQLQENKMSISEVTGCIIIDSELHVQPFFKRVLIPLP